MMPVILIHGTPDRQCMQRARAELEQLATGLAAQPPERRRELTVVIDCAAEEHGDVLACWEFANRMMTLATEHGITTLAKVYASTANSTLIALAADWCEVRCGIFCPLSLGLLEVEVAGNLIDDAAALADLERRLESCRNGVQELICRKGYMVSAVIAFQDGEYFDLGRSGQRLAKLFVGAWFPLAQGEGQPLIRTVLISGSIDSQSIRQAMNEIDALLPELRSMPVAQRVLNLIIFSWGGSSVASEEFRKRLDDLAHIEGVAVHAKVYRSRSAATDIALRASFREVVKWGTMGFHIGIHRCQNLSRRSSSLALYSGRADIATFLQSLAVAKAERIKLFTSAANLPAESLRMLENEGRIEFRAEECLCYGLVHQVSPPD